MVVSWEWSPSEIFRKLYSVVVAFMHLWLWYFNGHSCSPLYYIKEEVIKPKPMVLVQLEEKKELEEEEAE